MELLAGFGEVGVVQSELKGAGKGDGWSLKLALGQGVGKGWEKSNLISPLRGGMHPSKHGATQLSLSTTGAQDAEGAARGSLQHAHLHPLKAPHSSCSRPPTAADGFFFEGAGVREGGVQTAKSAVLPIFYLIFPTFFLFAQGKSKTHFPDK